MPETSGEITRVLAELRGATREQALERLVPLVYAQLCTLAAAHLRRELPDHTLQTVDLVHETYFRLGGDREAAWPDRRHFFAAAAEAMRRILVDHARRRGAEKRGGGLVQVSLGAVAGEPVDQDELLALDDALLRLEEQDPRASEIVRLRFFAGLSVEETALALGLSERTVKREWAMARAWLYRALRAEADPSATHGSGA